MALDKKMKPFLIMQGAFMTTSLIGIWNNFFKKLAPMDNNLYKHTTEGKDDMPAHIKSALTNSHLTLSVKDNKITLGTWQGLYLFEHRLENQIRKISYHFIGN